MTFADGKEKETSVPPSFAPTSTRITDEVIQRAIENLEDERQKDFIKRCINKDPKLRPTARELLFHPALFEVHGLKLLAAHALNDAPGKVDGSVEL